jgi:ribonuclease P protein component
LKQNHLRKQAEFARVYSARAGRGGRLLVLHSVPNQLDRPRVGLSVSARVGGAVVRNRLRRRLRAAMREALPADAPAADMIVVARPAAAAASYAELVAEVHHLLGRVAPS